MKDNFTALKTTIENQEKQILSLRKAIDLLMHRLKDTDARARRNSEGVRRLTNDINTIKRKK